MTYFINNVSAGETLLEVVEAIRTLPPKGEIRVYCPEWKGTVAYANGFIVAHCEKAMPTEMAFLMTWLELGMHHVD